MYAPRSSGAAKNGECPDMWLWPVSRTFETLACVSLLGRSSLVFGAFVRRESALFRALFGTN